MPDGTGAPIAPQSPYARRLDVLKRYRRREAGEARKRRRVTAHRLAQLEQLIARIIDASEVIAHIEVDDPVAPSIGVCLLTTLHCAHFQQLCALGAELEDDEDGDGGGDDEDSEPDHDGEPSLGSCDAIMDQERWHDGGWSDRELDRCDDEENGDREPDVDREGSLVQAAEGMHMQGLGSHLEEHVPLPPEKVTAARARYFAARPRLARALKVQP